jgi:hypothetical protein
MKRHIDDIVKDALENFEVPYDPTSWDAMNHRIEHELNEDFDAEIKSVVRNIHKTYQHRHWLQLKEWLDYSWYATNKIYINKMAECALMLLALFTFFNYAQQQQNKTASQEYAEHARASSQDLTINALNRDQDKSIVQKADNKIAPVQEKSVKQTVKQRGSANHALEVQNSRTNHLKSKRAVTDIKAKSFSPNNSLNIESNSSTSQKPIALIESEPIKHDVVAKSNQSNFPSKVSDDSNLSASQVNLNDANEVFQNVVDLNERKMALASIELFELSSLDFSKGNELQAAPQPTIAQTRNPFDKKWAISAFTDMNFNHITTPYDELYLKSGYDQNRVGYGGGLMVHRELGPVELSTGVGYTSKKYSPKQFIELFKRSEDSDGTEYRFEGVKLNVLTIPIHLSYLISKKGKWRPYVTAGGAVHLALQAEYKKEDRRVSRSTSVPQYLDENQGATYTVGRTPNFEKKKFPDGLLENGSFKDNHYFTLDLGFGIERKISPSTSLFFQPTVFYNLFNKGLSANNDKINTFAMQIGVKTRI